MVTPEQSNALADVVTRALTQPHLGAKSFLMDLESIFNNALRDQRMEMEKRHAQELAVREDTIERLTRAQK